MTILESDKSKTPMSSSSSSSAAMLAVTTSSALADRYINPDYLAHLPPTESEKSGKSPLQLLAQTCSQIGADTGSTRLESRSKRGSSRSPTLVVDSKPSVAFKPYEESSKRRLVSPKTKSPSPKTSCKSPIVHSGLDVLAGHPKDVPLGTYRPPPTSTTSSALSPSVESLSSNPAFRSALANPFDPALAAYNAHLATLATLAPGYAELLQAHKMAASLPATSPLLSPPASSSAASNAFVCNWMNGRDGYCGKRHSSADELLGHLRTHTTLNTETTPNFSSAMAALANLPRAGGHRFHPYAKPVSPLSAYPAVFPHMFAPGAAAASLYALYGQPR